MTGYHKIKMHEYPDHPVAQERIFRLLVVDDSADMQNYLVCLLTEKWIVETAINGAAALELLYQQEFDLIITDFIMPVLDGFGLLKAVRADSLLKKIPIVMITGRAEIETRIDSLDQGANAYLIKPFSAHEVLLCVETQLKLVSRAQLALENELLRREKEIAEQNNQAKDLLLATLSHELRTPLTSILCWTHALKAKVTEPAKILQGLNAIEKSTLAQQQLVNDLLDVSSIVMGQIAIKPQKTNLIELLSHSVEFFQNEASQKQITIRLLYDKEPVWHYLDPDRMRQVFNNLITNAIKFTPVEGELSIKVLTTTAQTTIIFEDNGVGISADFIPHLFKRFTQEKVSVNTSKGLGLGLSLVHDFICLHGGTIQALSEGLNTGTQFIIQLPYNNELVLQSDPKKDYAD